MMHVLGSAVLTSTYLRFNMSNASIPSESIVTRLGSRASMLNSSPELMTKYLPGKNES